MAATADRPNRIIVAGASAGGPAALRSLVAGLDPALPAALFVVQHVAPQSPRLLAQMLESAGPLPASHAREGEPVRAGRIVVAPPDHHLLLQAPDGRGGLLRVTNGPRQNRVRPSIDVLFRSAAVAYDSRVIGLLLTGMQDDGVDGLRAIQRCGGVTIVQEPAEAEFPELVQAALAAMTVDYRLPIVEIARLLNRLAGEPVAAGGQVPEALRLEVAVSLDGDSTLDEMRQIGEPVTLTCPDCGGRLWQKGDGEYAHYTCEVGHAFSAQALLAGMDSQIERSLWVALRTLEERVRMLERMAGEAERAGRGRAAEEWRARAEETRADAENVRRFLLRGVRSSQEPD
jgi:two-component system chemotaxis response regulator CheB